MGRAWIAAGLVGIAVIGTGQAVVRGQAPATSEGAAAGGAATVAPDVTIGHSTAPRPDAGALGFPRSLLQREPQFGIAPWLAILPGGLLVLMALLGIATMRMAKRPR
jgi:hypothetical protein